MYNIIEETQNRSHSRTVHMLCKVTSFLLYFNSTTSDNSTQKEDYHSNSIINCPAEENLKGLMTLKPRSLGLFSVYVLLNSFFNDFLKQQISHIAPMNHISHYIKEFKYYEEGARSNQIIINNSFAFNLDLV